MSVAADASMASFDTALSRLLDAMLTLHQQDALGGVLAAAAGICGRLAPGSYLGCMLRDGGAGAWHFTALLDDAGRPVDLGSLGAPLGPLRFQPPPSVVGLQLCDVMEGAWDARACAAVESRLRATVAICAPIGAAGEVQGALLAVLPALDGAARVPLVLSHAAVAAARLISQEREDGDRVLDPRTFAVRAEHELARADRYHREVTVVVFALHSVAEMADFGPILARSLRRWDFVGRPAGHDTALAAVLPETGRTAAQAVYQRIYADLRGVQAASAVFPHDGAGISGLVETAHGRVTHGHTLQGDLPAPREGTITWVKGAAAGPGEDTVRCPRCLAIFSRKLDGRTREAVLERIRSVTRTQLQADCPLHPNWLTVPFGRRKLLRRILPGKSA